MPERRLSRLLKAKLLRRSSSSAVSEGAKAAGDGADPGVNPNSNSSSNSIPSSPLLSRGQGSQRPRPYSCASSPPVDYLVYTDCPAGAAPGLAKAERHAAPQVHGPSAQTGADEEGQGGRDDGHDTIRKKDKGSRRSHQGEIRVRGKASGSTTAPNPAGSSLPRTPTTDPAFPPSTTSTPCSASQQSDAYSLRTATLKVRERAAGDTLELPLTPSADPVAESPFGESSRGTPAFTPATPGVPKRPSIAVRRQSLLPASQQHLVRNLLEPGLVSQHGDRFVSPFATFTPEMVLRKIWVKRPGASATIVSVTEDDMVDDLRDIVLRKYPNSLGRSFDSPDLLIRITPREGFNRQNYHERILNPEESLADVMDAYYPGGQDVEEALVIDIPQRRTPKPSPRQPMYYQHAEPGEHGEYFPLMPVNVGTPPAHPPSAMSSASGVSTHPTPSISILTTGKVPPLPSPGSRATRHPRRPPFPRHATNSPTIVAPSSAAKDINVSVNGQAAPPAPSIPTPPAPAPESPQNKSLTPPARGASPRPARKLKKANGSLSPGAAFGGLIEGTVPPINVLIVEDNVINQKLLEAFMKRLSVRWQCAPNGEVAVRKWRQGGFHLVLMDIQLPVMNGLEATKEIRRLERLNGIGVFSKTASGRSSATSTAATSPTDGRAVSQTRVKEEDVLEDLSLFKSPVIIVALTASSLQSDRHEALAAGCNDFLTKPVGFPWLEQKVTEWGCMQALIDFEGWRKWRGFADSIQPSLHLDGSNEVWKKTAPTSPSLSRNAGSQLGIRTTGVNSANDAPLRPTVIGPVDSSGSGSGSGETLDSPVSFTTSIKNGEITADIQELE